MPAELPLFQQLNNRILHLARLLNRPKPANSLSQIQIAILQALHSQPLSVPALARLTRTSRQNVQTIVDRLRARGLVVDKQNPAHKRSPLYSRTEQGMELLDQVEQSRMQAQPIPTDEIESVLRLLERWEGILTAHAQIVGTSTRPAALTRRSRATRSARVRPSETVVMPVMGTVPVTETAEDGGELPVSLL